MYVWSPWGGVTAKSRPRQNYMNGARPLQSARHTSFTLDPLQIVGQPSMLLQS